MIEHEMRPARKLPVGLKVAINCVVIFHLLALVVVALSAPSGPWSVQYLPMTGFSDAPMFAKKIDEVTTRFYLQPLNLANNYHFTDNHTDLPVVRIEARPK